MAAPRPGRSALSRPRLDQIGWLVALWAASVVALGAVAFLLRLAVRATLP